MVIVALIMKILDGMSIVVNAVKAEVRGLSLDTKDQIHIIGVLMVGVI
jgi:hypothetical protein